MNKDRFYIIYNYDIKELPYMLCDTIKDVAQAIGYSERMIKHGLNKGYVFTTQGNKRYTVQAWNMNELKGV
jgi:hypothetical protein